MSVTTMSKGEEDKISEEVTAIIINIMQKYEVPPDFPTSALVEAFQQGVVYWQLKTSKIVEETFNAERRQRD